MSCFILRINCCKSSLEKTPPGTWKLLSMSSLLFFVLLCSSAAFASAQGSDRGSKWQTLSGDAPLVIARGGFSGMFPDSSSYAYQLAVQTGLPNLHVWCDVQLTKDGAGICFPDIKLDNASDIDTRFGKKQNTYTVNGSPIKGWFSVDFTFNELQTVNLKQGIYSRAPYFDRNAMQILRVDEVVNLTKPAKLWLNIQYDAFFNQHNLSMRSFIISVSRSKIINYISSPEVGFLRSIVSQFGTGPTKLIFQFLDKDKMEPSTNQTYGSLMTNLTFIKTFATGILVPKNYILPVDDQQYLGTYTSLVLDAHNQGLEVFASNFLNDVALPYNYSYDPVAEYLSFIDNGQFSVDGVLSDFPLTASATIECYSHMGEHDTLQANFLIISPEGSSGFYPGCTVNAYDKAVKDGADILECPVQMTSDGIPFCLGSIDLRDRTTVAQSIFSDLATTNRDLNIKDGVFAYSLTWNQILMLKPTLVSPYSNFSLFRNPRANRDGNFQPFRNPNTDGSFLQLSDFLTRANYAPSISGVLISIENAAYLAEKQGLGVTDAVLDALRNSGYNNQTAKRVMIKSSDSAVLSKFKSSGYHDLVYVVDEVVSDILNSTILEMTEFASSVVIYKRSVFPTHAAFVTGETAIVPKLHAFNLSVYVQLFSNEVVSQPWDFFSDAYVEINTHVSYMEIDGVITDYPATAARFRRNRCLGYKELPTYMSPARPGGLIQLVAALPPAEAPSPVLTEIDVMEPPLPTTPTMNPPLPTTPTMNPDQKKDSRKIIIIVVVVGSVIISICTYFSWKWIAKHRDKKKTIELAKADALGPVDSSLQDALSQVNLQELPFFKFDILSNATSNFSEANKLGKGGFGSVYKGELVDGREIAVKRLSQASGQGMREFMNEVVLISKLQHRNLVKLLGCCTENNETMLIYEYLPNKSLDFFLFDTSQEILDWRKRLNIIEGICRGLLYLHRDSRLKIIHRDLKPSNILLDNNYNPKISDFGMARIFGTIRDHASTIRVVGTYGYMAPEYAMEGRFSEKSDVFSFGVLMLEIATGRRNTSFYHEDGPLNLLGYVWKLWNEDNVAASIDPRISSPRYRAEVVRCMHIGLLCVQEHPKDRPSTSAVLSMISSEIIELPEPNRPAFIITSSHCHACTSSCQQSKSSPSINNVSFTEVDGR